MTSTIFLQAIAAGIVLLGAYTLLRYHRRSLSLPPGPKGLPLLGMLGRMPQEGAWTVFASWAKKYGDMLHVQVLQQHIIILHSLETTNEMLDKKSNIYSDRPRLTMGGELVGWNRILALTPYGRLFRQYRRLFHGLMGNRAYLGDLLPSAHQETTRLLQNILDQPDQLRRHIRRASTAYILRISHGYSLSDEHDPIVDVVEKATGQLSMLLVPGAFMVDILPFLKHLPQWLPKLQFQKTAEHWAQTLKVMVDLPFEFVKQQIDARCATVSFTRSALDMDEYDETVVKWAAGSLYSGGSDTTVSTIYAFFLAMVLYPEAQRRAQAEIDSVVGTDRLPTIDDRTHLPYVDSLVKEVFRCFPATPLGAPHRLIKDDVHAGYTIPKGSIVLANIWWFLHDPKRYSDPHMFDPTRYSAQPHRPADPDPLSICFGFGRRSCPGSLLADSVVFLACASCLAVLDIQKATKADGSPIEPVYRSTKGIISHPMPFECMIRARSERAAALVRTAAAS
ncbi:cytochrome P450 [Gloeophyllum trabeum ATCC 11539]|uniref:Cytochrome P450 n=1 Tax=Gloeophyllum trabeum (strain ATCC 11539 / FP-39264 / Madison 617) TaxID=670483 RepID=S7PTV7_GLOTA|nr:cytochrome P450 [Gloeophyllum trabeum ATCC 11539]EPQ51236.1 cytochrome P450 [Gloeophyllum trabeum ATCC 11539]